MKLAFFSRRHRRAATIEALYGAIVAQARAPVFYLEYGIPDTVNGRFEMILLHAGLLLDRLSGDAAETRGLGQDIFDRFCLDMDDTLRERGISDIKVPKEMKRVAEAFYGRQAAYHAALNEADPVALQDALRRNVYAGVSEPGAERLAAYMHAARAALQRQDTASLTEARLAWPAPDAISTSDVR